MDLNEVFVFINVVQSSSFSGAAKKLAMPVSTVSFKVSSLEKRLGLTLIQRTTRKLHITPAGQAYYNKCVEGLASIEEAEHEITATQDEPSGLLRLTSFYEVATTILPAVISKFTAKYPKARVELIITDRMVDLISESVDLAIRAGVLKDSSLMAKKIGSSCFGLFAAPSYLKSRGNLSHPRELIQHRCLQFTALGIDEWKLLGPSGAFNVPLKGRVIMNSLNGLKTMAAMGDGIANLPTYFAEDEIKAKSLVRVLPEWRSALSSMHFVYPGQKYVSPNVKAFMAIAMDALKNSFGKENI
jgi:DNA-binding transcriptional LysR family regulator